MSVQLGSNRSPALLSAVVALVLLATGWAAGRHHGFSKLDAPHSVDKDTASNSAYIPSLTARELKRGVVSHGDMARARRVFAKMLRGEAVTVALVGGSVTWGTHLDLQLRLQISYAGRVLNWINSTFPAPHKLINGGVPATSSSYFALCHGQHVSDDAEIIFLELAVNDGEDVGDSPARRAHERLIRTFLGFKHRPAVVEFAHYVHPMSGIKFPNNRVPYRAMHGPDEVAVLAQYYHLPFLSTRSMVWGQIGLPEVLLEGLGPEPNPPGKFKRMWVDQRHLSPLGHQWVADLFIHWMASVRDDVARDPLGPDDEAAAQEDLPVPMYPGNYESLQNACHMAEQLKPLMVQKHSAFKWVNEGTKEKPSFGYISTTPNSSLDLLVDTSVLTRRPAAPGNAIVAIAYLKSYEHMGIFEVRCTQNCTCEPLTLDGHQQERASQLHLASMVVSSSAACHLQVTVLQASSSGEHKVKIMGLVVSGIASELILEQGKQTDAINSDTFNNAFQRFVDLPANLSWPAAL